MGGKRNRPLSESDEDSESCDISDDRGKFDMQDQLNWEDQENTKYQNQINRYRESIQKYLLSIHKTQDAAQQ